MSAAAWQRLEGAGLALGGLLIAFFAAPGWGALVWIGLLVAPDLAMLGYLAGPRIGALLFMVLVLAGQLGMALVLDHNGWAGFREAPITLGKAAGLALIIGGVWLIRRG